MLQYGPAFQVLAQVYTSAKGNAAWGHLTGHAESDESGMMVSPSLLDGCMQLGAALQRRETQSPDDRGSGGAKIPSGFAAYCISRRVDGRHVFGVAYESECLDADARLGRTSSSAWSSHALVGGDGSLLTSLDRLEAKEIMSVRKQLPSRSLVSLFTGRDFTAPSANAACRCCCKQ